MLFPEEFIKLQFIFADKIAEVLKISFQDALFEYTSMPVRVGVPFAKMEKENKTWQEILSFAKSKDDFKKAYELHENLMKNAPPMRMQFGCFSYDYLDEEKLVKIHFANNDKNPKVLSDEQIPKRLEELKQVFSDIYTKKPEAKEVLSSSWLYNVEKFKRLFPQEFFQNTSVKWDFHSLGIWGQFIDKYGKIKQQQYDKFVENLEKARSFDEVKESFQLKDVKCWSEIKPFYRMYGII